MSHMPRKTRIVVLFGGSSPEHDVSVISASQLMDAVDVRHFEVIPVHMAGTTCFAQARACGTFRAIGPCLAD